MNATVQKWGNSLALRIPKALADEIRLQKGSPVRIAIEEGRMVVKPAGKRRLSLSSLLEGMNDGNLHTEQDWGASRGREAL